MIAHKNVVEKNCGGFVFHNKVKLHKTNVNGVHEGVGCVGNRKLRIKGIIIQKVIVM